MLHMKSECCRHLAALCSKKRYSRKRAKFWVLFCVDPEIKMETHLKTLSSTYNKVKCTPFDSAPSVFKNEKGVTLRNYDPDARDVIALELRNIMVRCCAYCPGMQAALVLPD